MHLLFLAVLVAGSAAESQGDRWIRYRGCTDVANNNYPCVNWLKVPEVSRVSDEDREKYGKPAYVGGAYKSLAMHSKNKNGPDRK